MLVVISDLHLVDETAGYHNVPEHAYQLWLEHVLDLAETQRITELVFLYLGDMFDLIRSEQWLDVPLCDRPWGDPEINRRPRELGAACRGKLHDVIDATAVAARGQLDVLAGRGPAELKRRLDSLGVPVRRVFIGGNHDRLYWIDDALKRKIDDLLAVSPEGVEGATAHSLISPTYGVIARHGHEFDLWNYEGRMPEPELDDDYELPDDGFLKVPIGDPVTTELMVRLPVVVKQRLVERRLSPGVIEGFYRRLQEIQDVRPIHSAIQWTYYKTRDLLARGPGPASERAIANEIIEQAVRDVFSEFMRQDFTRAWLGVHDRWTHPLDEADQLQALNLVFQSGLSLDAMGSAIRAFSRIGSGRGGPHLAGAAGEPLLRERSSGIHYAVYGHTHRYEQVPLGGLDGHEQIYFNSGTWRPRIIRARNDRDFAEWKEMTYLIFYNADEDPPQGYTLAQKGLSFETWTGTKLKRRRDLPDAPLAR